MITKNPLYFPVLPFSCAHEIATDVDGIIVYKTDYGCLHDAFALYRHMSKSLQSMPAVAICDYIAATGNSPAKQYWRSLKRNCKRLPTDTIRFANDVDYVVAFVNVLQELTEQRRGYHAWWNVEIEEEWFAYLNELRLCNR